MQDSTYGVSLHCVTSSEVNYLLVNFLLHMGPVWILYTCFTSLPSSGLFSTLRLIVTMASITQEIKLYLTYIQFKHYRHLSIEYLIDVTPEGNYIMLLVLTQYTAEE